MYKYIFWDWNGTLLDDAYAACDAVNDMLDERGLPNITLTEYRDLIEVPIINFYKKVMDISDETMEKLACEFNPLCEKHLKDEPLFSKTKETLALFHKLGYKQYIFSSSQNKYIEPKLKRFGLDIYFEAVLGAPDCFVGSKIERTRDYLLNNGIPKDECVFIGDMVHDSETASCIGADCILISAGHQCEKALLATGRRVLSSLSELPEIINNNSLQGVE